jgi:hypothetical protein
VPNSRCTSRGTPSPTGARSWDGVVDGTRQLGDLTSAKKALVRLLDRQCRFPPEPTSPRGSQGTASHQEMCDLPPRSDRGVHLVQRRGSTRPGKDERPVCLTAEIRRLLSQAIPAWRNHAGACPGRARIVRGRVGRRAREARGRDCGTPSVTKCSMNNKPVGSR